MNIERKDLYNKVTKRKRTVLICIEETFCKYCGNVLQNLTCRCDDSKTGIPFFNPYSGCPLEKEEK